MDAAVWGFIGVIVGVLITLGAEVILSRDEANPDSRSSRRRAERDQFQRSTLVKLQAALESFAGTALAIGAARHAEASAAGEWRPFGDHTLTPELTEANREANRERLRALCDIMAKVHVLAEVAWPRDDCGMSEMPNEGLLAIMDVQGEASKALGLPEDLDLMTGDPLIDL